MVNLYNTKYYIATHKFCLFLVGAQDFFDLVVMSFEKLSSAGGYYRMSKVLEVFSKARLPILMLDLKQDGHGLIVRLFKHFLNVSE